MEREDSLSGGEIFASTHVLARSVGHVINMVEFMSAAKDADKSGDRSEISNNNIINVTKQYLKDVQKQQLAQAVDVFKASCLQSFSFVWREGKIIQKGALPSPRHITITEDPRKFHELFDQAMHHAMITKSKVMTNSIQNAIYQMISSQWTPGYIMLEYSQAESSVAAASRATTSPAAGIGFGIRSYATYVLPATGVFIRGHSGTNGADIHHQFAVNGYTGPGKPLQHSTMLCSANISWDAS